MHANGSPFWIAHHEILASVAAVLTEAHRDYQPEWQLVYDACNINKRGADAASEVALTLNRRIIAPIGDVYTTSDGSRFNVRGNGSWSLVQPRRTSG